MAKSESNQLISCPQFAKLMGVSRQAVLKAIDEGRITAVKKGRGYMVNPETASTQWHNSKTTTVHNDPNAGEQPAMNLNALKQMRLKIQIQKEQIELQKTKKELVSSREINDALFKMGVEIRQKFQQIPGQIIDDVLAAQTRNEALMLLTDAIDGVLSDLSNIAI